jgi:diaminohydroxyphosphoribosylaminopyrimidine deaminase / 5-amino-6-(5-phosphoribosylamino)uracil reductase
MNSDEVTSTDQQIMQSCLELAQQAEGRTSPNPMVGAIVLDAKGKIVGTGFHKKSGTAHAEVYALGEAGEQARGGTLYVTLEPCCHHGKTPPCSDLVTKSGVSRVVAAMVDPNPKVAGKGIKQLHDAGIAVTVGVLEAEAEWLNRGFLKRIKKGLPWLCLKLALTLDGRIADRTGSSRWVTGPESRQKVHELRNKFDAVLVGANTLKADDPELTVRDIDESRNPIRVGLDARLQTEASSRFCMTEANARTILFATQNAIDEKIGVYPSYIELIAGPLKEGQINLSFAMQKLAQQGINTVLCEGGGKLAGSLLENGLIDEIYWVIAPKFLADEHAIPALKIGSSVPLTRAWNLRNMTTENIGNDIWIHGVL